MRSNSLIKFILALLFISCVFQFALLIPIKKVEQKAMNEAYLQASKKPYEQQAKAYQLYYNDYMDIARNKIIFSIPYIKDYSYQSLKDRQLQLGIDLKGGVQYTLSFDSYAFLNDLTESKNDPSFSTALLKTSQQTQLAHSAFIDAFFDYYQTIESTEKIIQRFSYNPQLNQVPNDIETVDQLRKHIHALSKTKLKDTKYLLSQRLNHSGLGQVYLNIDSDRHNIQVQVPGANDPERIRGLLVDVAELEFWHIYRVNDPGILDALVKADQLL